LMKILLPFVAFLLSSFAVLAGPNLVVSPAALTSFSYVVANGPSVSQTVVLSSQIMGNISGSLMVTGTTDYEVSLNNSTFSGSVSIPYSDDTLGATNLYVRLKSGRAASAYNHEMISMANGVFTKQLDVSGVVTAQALVVNLVVQNTSTVMLNWGNVNTSPDSWEYQLDQVAANPAGSGTVATASTHTATGLAADTTYYFHVRAKYGINFTAWTTRSFTTNSSGMEIPVCRVAPGLYINPNPSRGAFGIDASFDDLSQTTASVWIVNAVGRVAWTGSMQVDKGYGGTSIQASLPAGVYSLFVQGAHQSRGVSIVVVQ
jgi:hypothetical protein